MIYENIRKYADKKNLSITELEKRAGLAKGAIDKWKRSNPNVNNLKAVADVLHVKIDTLIKE